MLERLEVAFVCLYEDLRTFELLVQRQTRRKAPPNRFKFAAKVNFLPISFRGGVHIRVVYSTDSRKQRVCVGVSGVRAVYSSSSGAAANA